MEPIARAKLAVWVFAGGRDPFFRVPSFYPALNKLAALGLKDVRFTIHADRRLNSWDRVYAGHDLYERLLAQKKPAP